MIIKINGAVINPSVTDPVDFDIKSYLPKNKIELNKYKKLSTWLWTLSGTFLFKSNVLATSSGSTSMWVQMQPLWAVFQDIALILGGIAIFVGMLTFLFKRSVGKTVIVASVLVVGGCFLVPSALMLIAIIGSMMNDVLMGVFQNLDFKNSVKVGG
ncbi:hypothetical protein [Cytobacillus praedii]|uniref:Uncharacterized protein n=1 Tax=Cytobacillus praedii TaxID=1742358 RepID=A0A4R1AMM3_9BACI|nr:hypothetical protein [Cytobacillus praedii]TCJ00969.1 hypothetical protein E0Y62_26325 [Cytobacillus praedii]